MDKDSSEQGKSTNNSLAQKNQSVSSLVQNSGIIESLQALTNSNSLAVAANNRKQRHTILSQNQDSTWDNQVGIKFSIERKVDGLPSIFLNNIQHSGTHFFSTRFPPFHTQNSRRFHHIHTLFQVIFQNFKKRLLCSRSLKF